MTILRCCNSALIQHIHGLSYSIYDICTLIVNFLGVGVTGSPPRTVSYGGLLAGLIGGVSALALAGITGGLLAASFIRRRKRLL